MSKPITEVTGLLEVNPKGFAFLRQKNLLFKESEKDPFVSPELVRKLRLKSGLEVVADKSFNNSGKPVIKHIHKVNGMHPSQFRKVRPFHYLTSVTPYQRIRLERPGGPLSMRIVDVAAPIGKGSRSLIVAPPKTGKTTLIKEILNSVVVNHPEIETYALLVDERPEEVTDFCRSFKGEVFASSLDQPIASHIKLTRLIGEMVKHKVELGKDVLVVIDSITRVARAFNNYEGNSGRTMSGGLDSWALEYPRSFFGSARKVEGRGSLTLIATTLVDTGSKMDELIFQEFQGTGNQEIYLSRYLSDRRIYPAIDIKRSRTRREEKLLTPDELLAVNRMRKGLSSLHPDKAMERLIETLQKFPDNQSFVNMLVSALSS